MLPFFASKQTFTRIDFLRQGGRLVHGKGTQNVKFLAENYTKGDCAVYARMATARKTCTLATASANDYRECCSWTTRTASWKLRSNLPLTGGFQLVETALNNFHLITFWDITTFCRIQMGRNFMFHRFFVWHFVHERECLSWFYSTKT